jgi:hypothetical protein
MGMKTFELQVNIESFRGIEIDMPKFYWFSTIWKESTETDRESPDPMMIYVKNGYCKEYLLYISIVNIIFLSGSMIFLNK